MPSFSFTNVNLNLNRTSKFVFKKEKFFKIKDILFQNLIAHPYTNKLHTNSWLLLPTADAATVITCYGLQEALIFENYDLP